MNKKLSSYWDNRFKRNAVKLLPGEFYVCSGDEMIVTVLGSCISACIYESNLGIGGMNHFMLPMSSEKNTAANHSLVIRNSNAARYGNVAMELVINEIIKLGGQRDNLSAKIFGGAAVTSSSINIGQNNIDYVKEYLELESIPIISSDIGGTKPRKLYYIPSNNEAYVKTIQNIHNHTLKNREEQYKKELRAEERGNNVFYLEED